MNSDNVKMVTTVASFLTREVAKENGVYPFVLLRRGWMESRDSARSKRSDVFIYCIDVHWINGSAGDHQMIAF